MKKILFAAVTLVALASCSKDYTCTCTGTTHIEGTDINYNYNVNGTKKNAEKSCKDDSYTNTLAEVTCKIK